MQTIAYLPSANRRCGNCGHTKAEPEVVARRTLAHVLTVTGLCEHCGDPIELDARPFVLPPRHHNPHYVPRCAECCSEDYLACCEVDLPDGLGRGYVYLCAECVARHDEGSRPAITSPLPGR